MSNVKNMSFYLEQLLKMKYAPVLIPTLNRDRHFIKLMESLKKNTWACHTDIIIGVDYPPNDKYTQGWKIICEYLDKSDFSVFHKIVVHKHSKNLGVVGNSIFLGKYIREHYDRWIRCDDDCEFSPNFLEYMDKCLDQFEGDPDVVAINGYSYPIQWRTSECGTCFKQDFNVATWGLGLWRDKLNLVRDYIITNKMLKDAPSVIKEKRYLKMIDSTFLEYFESSLRYAGKPFFMNQITDVSMTSYLACAGKYAITPLMSKVRNLGFDGSGLYCIATDGDGRDARHMNYSKQQIDESNSFDLVLNDDNLLEANRDLMNRFDCVSEEELRTARRNFWMIKHFGYCFSKFIHHIIAVFRYIINSIKKL